MDHRILIKAYSLIVIFSLFTGHSADAQFRPTVTPARVKVTYENQNNSTPQSVAVPPWARQAYVKIWGAGGGGGGCSDRIGGNGGGGGFLAGTLSVEGVPTLDVRVGGGGPRGLRFGTGPYWGYGGGGGGYSSIFISGVPKFVVGGGGGGGGNGQSSGVTAGSGGAGTGAANGANGGTANGPGGGAGGREDGSGGQSGTNVSCTPAGLVAGGSLQGGTGNVCIGGGALTTGTGGYFGGGTNNRQNVTPIRDICASGGGGGGYYGGGGGGGTRTSNDACAGGGGGAGYSQVTTGVVALERVPTAPIITMTPPRFTDPDNNSSYGQGGTGCLDTASIGSGDSVPGQDGLVVIYFY